MKNKSPFSAFLTGALIGAIAALLTAPKSGKQTRDDLSKKVDTESKKIAKTVKKNTAKAQRVAKKTASELKKEFNTKK